jgi:CheY-like chemotaxis protein
MTTKTMEKQALHHVMIVDDDVFSSMPLELALRDMATVLNVQSGVDALLQINQFKPDVVLLDINMPDLNGYDTCQRLRKMELAVQPAVIFISGYDTLEERLQAYDSGGDDFITKPAIPDEVVYKVRTLLKLVAVRQQLQQEQTSKRQIFDTFSDTSNLVHFMRESGRCQTLSELAMFTIKHLSDYHLKAQIQIRPASDVCLTFDASGVASPLEESVFKQVKEMGRVFQFRRQMVINFSNVSLLIRNMPIDNPDQCGRWRDHLALIMECCSTKTNYLTKLAELNIYKQHVQDMTIIAGDILDQFHQQYYAKQTQATTILHQLHEQGLKQLFTLDLLSAQEHQLETLLTSTLETAMDVFHDDFDFEAQKNALEQRLTTPLPIKFTPKSS